MMCAVLAVDGKLQTPERASKCQHRCRGGGGGGAGERRGGEGRGGGGGGGGGGQLSPDDHAHSPPANYSPPCSGMVWE